MTKKALRKKERKPHEYGIKWSPVPLLELGSKVNYVAVPPHNLQSHSEHIRLWVGILQVMVWYLTIYINWGS